MMRQIAQVKVDRIYTSRSTATLPNAAKAEVPDTFRAVFECANNNLKTKSFHFLEQILTWMARNEALIGVFDHNIEHWCQSSTIIDALFRRALTSYHIVPLVVKFIQKIIKNQTNITDSETNPRESPFLLLETLLPSSQLSDSKVYRIRGKTRKIELDIIPDVSKKRKKQK